MATLLQDTFTGTNGTNLTAHTMNVGPGWTVPSGGYNIQSNAALSNGAAGKQIAFSDASNADTVITLDVAIPAVTAYVAGALVRYADTSNYWACLVEDDTNSNDTQHYIYIYKFQAGSGTVQGGTSSFISGLRGTTQTLTITLSGNSFTFDISGSPTSTRTTSNSFGNANTNFGLWNDSTGGYANVSFDNFLVTGGAASTTWGPLLAQMNNRLAGAY